MRHEPSSMNSVGSRLLWS